MTYTRITHQYSLFDYKEVRPRLKIPINKKRLLEGKALMAKGDKKGAVEAMRDVREGLENYLRRLK